MLVLDDAYTSKFSVPKNWKSCSLEDVATTVNGRSYKSKELTESKTALVTLKSFKQGGGYRQEGLKPYIGRYKPEQVIQPGEIVIACTDVSQRAAVIGRPAIVQKSKKYKTLVASLDTLIIRTKNKLINKSFLYYLISTNKFTSFIKHHTTGTIVLHLRKQSIFEYKFFLPPLTEQKRIVIKIKSIFTQIDILEESLKSVKSQMAQYKQLVLKLAFEGKLVLQRPETSWECVKISEICELIGGGTPSRKQPKYFGGDTVWLTPTEISKTKIVLVTNSREKITKTGLERSSAKIIPKDAVLLTSRASIGYVAIAGTNLSTNQGFMSFVCNNSIHNYFLAYWLVSNRHLLKQSASGTTFKEISKSKMRKFSILMPSIPEQKRIVAKIKSIFAHVDMTDEHITRLQTTLTTLRQSVLQHAFEGNLAPQDPNDESTYKLLEQ